jgi:cysteine desulfurase
MQSNSFESELEPPRADADEAEQPELIYLDYNATTPVDPEVIDICMPWLFQHFGNPSSSYALGGMARAGVETARAQVAALINCTAPEITFVSSATESINLALKGAALAARALNPARNRIVTVATEHVAVLEVCAHLASIGFELTVLGVDGDGVVSQAALVAAVDAERTALVSIMYANNETGTVQDIAALRAAVRAKAPRALFHTDAAQACGKMAVDVKALGVDMLTMAAHKMGAPKNAGALYTRAGMAPPLEPLMHGASQEGGRRAGTESVMMIAALGAACSLAQQHLSRTYRHMQRLRDRLLDGIVRELARRMTGGDEAAVRGARNLVRVNGHATSRLPNTLSIGFGGGCVATRLLERLESRVACSAGAACHSHAPADPSAVVDPAASSASAVPAVKVSHVLRAMGVPTAFAIGTLRLSVGKQTTEKEVDDAAVLVATAVHEEHQALAEAAAAAAATAGTADVSSPPAP